MADITSFGAIGDGVHDDTAAIQAALDASMEVYAPVPSAYYLTSAKLNVHPTGSLFGNSRNATYFKRVGADQTYFGLGDHASLRGIGMGKTGGIVPTTGIAIDLGSQCSISEIETQDIWTGVHFGGKTSSFAHGLYFHDVRESALKVDAVGGLGGDLFMDRFMFIGHAANNTAALISIMDAGEAITISNGDVIGGGYGMFMGAASYTGRNHPSFNKLTSVYFDSSQNGCVVQRSDVIDLLDCWFSSTLNGNGLNINTSDSVSVIGGQAVNNHVHGIAIGEAGATRTAIKGVLAACNGQGGTGNGIVAVGGVSNFRIEDNTCTNGPVGTALAAGHQQWGIWIDAGPGDWYYLNNNLVRGNVAGGITNQAYGANRVWTGNLG